MRNLDSRFSENPTSLEISRSKFTRACSVKTSFNTGDLVPFYIDEVLPGDTFSIDDSKVVRLSTLLTPIMDNLYLDTYYFFVPDRLVWDHWKEFNGENTESAWYPKVEYSIPQITAPAGGWTVGTLADYFGLPINVPNLSVSALPFRAYALICNEWFRDQNLTDPLFVDTSDVTTPGSNGDKDVDIVKGGKPFKVAKYHDYFTSCLPAPQKGPDVLLPLGNEAPVRALSKTHTLGDDWIRFVKREDGKPAVGYVGLDNGILAQGASNDGSTFSSSGGIEPSNLFADLSLATGSSINQLRLAFQIQKLYERDARGGTRYTEILQSHFGVTSPDARLQRPEYLGGNRKPINVTQVVQQSATVTDSPQGNTSAYSLTIDNESAFTKSFVEHGYVIGLMCVRYDHTYQQGIERFWSRKNRFDFYWPVFANIGEQAVLNKEIYAQGSDKDSEVFGYQEAWADYRYKPSRASGYMRSTAPTSLDVWHLGDNYSSLPHLSDSWIREDGKIVDRVITVTSDISHQFFADVFIRNTSVRPMPVYSVPGLIDHH
uniref:Major capsid protein n=1 Tax=Dulem virus 120 TaxID=3145597 RepID=A0AAU8AXX5_9VIRU